MIETRSFHLSDVQMRTSDDGQTAHFSGYASTTNQPYDVTDWMGSYAETIRSGAFSKTLREAPNVPLLFNHDGMPIASTRGGTMTLTEDESGLRVDADLDRRQTLTNDLCIAMERGDLSQMSFSFQAIKQQWSSDYAQRDVTELRLFDASLVTYPANPATTASLRAELVSNLGVEGRARVLAVENILGELREGKAISAANAELLQQALDALHKADDALNQVTPILKEVDAALDEGQQAISDTLGDANPDDDETDANDPDPEPDAKAASQPVGTAKDGTSNGGQALGGGGNNLSPSDGAGARKKTLSTVLETRALLRELREIA